MDKISRDVAQAEIESWLDFKKISDKKREVQKDQIEALIDAITDGSLELKEDKTFVHNLKFPIESELVTSKLQYKPRLKVSDTQIYLQGVKSSDVDGRVAAYVAALTSQPKGVIKALDTEDYGIAQSIAIFFF